MLTEPLFPFTAVVASEKLFHRAILQSGTIDSLRPTPLANRDTRFKTLAKNVGCGPALNLTAKCLVDCMRAVPVDTLLAAEVLLNWSPTIDNVLLKLTPLGYNNGTLYRVPTTIGYTSQDGSVFTGPVFQKLLAGQVPTVQDYNLFVAGAAAVFGAVGTARYNYAVGNITQVLYPISRYGNNPVLAATELVTDVAFRCVTLGYVSANNAVTRGANPVYVYEFSYLLSAFRAAAPQPAGILGVFHSSDIPFANGLFPAPLLSPGEVQLETEMLGAWVRFAASGNPNANPASPTWLPSSSGTKTAFGLPSKTLDPIVFPEKFAQCQALSRL
jgi:para-nitrobenzyl esterase